MTAPQPLATGDGMPGAAGPPGPMGPSGPPGERGAAGERCERVVFMNIETTANADNSQMKIYYY